MRLARQLLQVLRVSCAMRSALPTAHGASTGDGRHPRVRLAGVHPPGLGPHGDLLVPPAGRLGADQRVTPKGPSAWGVARALLGPLALPGLSSRWVRRGSAGALRCLRVFPYRSSRTLV